MASTQPTREVHPVVAIGALVLLGSCGLLATEPEDGFAGYGPCQPDDGENCLMLWGVSETADRFEVNVISETSTEVRIQVNAIGEKDDDDLVTGVQAFLSEPLGDRAVIDDSTGERVPIDESRG